MTDHGQPGQFTSMPEEVDEDDTSDISDSKFETKVIFGRTYQTYSIDNQINLEPVDDQEEDRLRVQHELLKRIFSSRRDPLLPDSIQTPGDILDCGFGTGDWAIEVAENHPDCNVVGLDISPILIEQSERPPNFSPELRVRALDPAWRSIIHEADRQQLIELVLGQIADLNVSGESFSFGTGSFDFVNSRFVAGGLAQVRWPSYVTDIRRILRRGGAAEMIEWDLFFRTDSGNGDRLAALRHWSETYLRSISLGQGNARKSRALPPDLETMMRVSGFTNVVARTIDVPLAASIQTDEASGLAEHARKNVESLLTSLALYPVVGRGVASEDQFRSLVSRCLEELRVPASELYMRLYVCYGEKP